MPVITYTTACTSKATIARGVVELRFTKPEGFTFKPGQFVLLDVPLVGGNPLPPTPSPLLGRGGVVETTQTRALSIASTPDESDLLFVIKIFPNGRLGRWITEVLKEGMSVTFKGPFGNFVLQQLPPPGPIPPARERGRDLLFIATGAGIAPFRPMVTAAAVDATRRIDILFGVRSEEDLFWKEWLEETTQAHPNVFHHIVLSQPSAAWTGHKGRVQVVAPQIMVRGQNARVGGKTLYVCGNPDMTTDVKRLALTEWGIDKKDLHVEGYI